jgi:2-polyprenyl-3-methyl-5-hydroxy-6-metoxy-1,4-benzoquinol methylase
MAKILKSLCQLFSSSLVFNSARDTWEKNKQDLSLPLSKLEKIYVGVYLILNDYSQGIFPPKFEQIELYNNETDYSKSLSQRAIIKPFWIDIFFYLEDFVKIFKLFSKYIPIQSNILELGAGGGWLAEFLAIAGYEVTALTLSTYDIEVIKTRSQSLKLKGVDGLKHIQSPMETVDEVCQKQFTAVYCYEALHHAYSWRDTLKASYNCLEDGGFLMILKEPNLLHTFISYRVAKLTNTHEIGFKSWELIPYLKSLGFTVRYQKKRFFPLLSYFWLVCQK